MKTLLAYGLIAGITLTVAGMAQSAGPDPNMDQDGDGYISILDLTILAEHFTEQVGPPNPCYTTGQYATPLTADGYTFSTYLLVPPGDPAAEGTARRLVPCAP